MSDKTGALKESGQSECRWVVRHTKRIRQSSLNIMSGREGGKGRKYEAARAVKIPRPQKVDADATGR